MERRYSENTLIAYRTDLHEFLGFLRFHLGEVPEIKHLQNLAHRDFRSWMARHAGAVGQEKRSKSSTARALSVVKNFFKYLDKHGYVHNPIAQNVRAPKLPKRLPRPLQVGDAKEMLELLGKLVVQKLMPLT